MDSGTHDLWHEKRNFYRLDARKELQELLKQGFRLTPMSEGKLDAVMKEFPPRQRQVNDTLRKANVKNLYVPKNFEDKKVSR